MNTKSGQEPHIAYVETNEQHRLNEARDSSLDVWLATRKLSREDFVSAQESASLAITAATDTCVYQKAPIRKSLRKTQPMIPAHDGSALHVLAGTWQFPAAM